MKFNEKLLKLRKENALSQEELGEKLNVTRQTVSKWELGETTPEMEKLVEMAKLFNISVDELIKETDAKEDAKNEAKKDKTANANKTPVIILVIVLIALFGFLGYKIVTGITGAFSEPFKMFSSISNITIDDAKNLVGDNLDKITSIGQQLEDLENKTTKNSKYKNLYSGLLSQVRTENAIKEVIKDNLNNERTITVTYNDKEYSEAKDLTDLIKILNKDEYLITLDYDSDGYLNKLNISDV